MAVEHVRRSGIETPRIARATSSISIPTPARCPRRRASCATLRASSFAFHLASLAKRCHGLRNHRLQGWMARSRGSRSTGPTGSTASPRAMHAELRDALANLGDARVVVLTGAGRGFCAGQDLNDRAVDRRARPSTSARRSRTCWNPLVRTPRRAAAAGHRAGQRRRRRRRRQPRAGLRPRHRREIGQVHPELFGASA